MQERSAPVAIIAGSGRLPGLLADTLSEAGRECRILAIRGFADASLRHRADAAADLLDVKRVLARLAEWRPGAVTLAGGVRRPGFAAIFSAASFLRNRGELKAVLDRGDDHLLRAVVSVLEEHGHRVLGVHDLAPGLLARGGVHGAHKPDAEDLRAIAVGKRLLTDISAYDIGQGAVVEGERVIAIEGPEGTDRMLARVRAFRRSWSLRRPPPEGVLVKMPKRGQDLRVDLPAIGPRTFVRAAKAGLRGVAIATGVTLVLDQDETVRTADRLGLFLVGVDAA
jgi:DUF1009 family protein